MRTNTPIISLVLAVSIVATLFGALWVQAGVESGWRVSADRRRSAAVLPALARPGRRYLGQGRRAQTRQCAVQSLGS